MSQWRAANPKLAAAADEKARIRGTAQTDNPLMRDMRSRMPAGAPTVQSPAVAKLGAGHQSLANNPNAGRAATPAATKTPAATPAAIKTPKEPTKKSRLDTALSGIGKWNEEVSPYDMVIDYLFSEGHVESIEEAHYIMMEMDQETIQGICEGRSSRPRYPGGRGVLDTETRQDKRDAAAENLRGHTFGPVTTTKNPKKLRKQKAMGEIEENFELWVNGLVEEGYNLSDYTWDEMYEFYLDELYKGKHGQSEEDYMDSRSDAGKQISGDSTHSGASYSHRSYRGVGEPARPGKRQKNQGRMTQADRDELEIRRRNLKKG